jgi:hypothetical protein
MVGSYTMILHYSIGSLLNKKASLDLNLDGEKDTVTRLLDEGIPITCIQQHTGHMSVESINNYAKKQLEDPAKNVCYFIKIKSCTVTFATYKAKQTTISMLKLIHRLEVLQYQM